MYYYWGQPNALGITFIGVGGGAYLPFLRLASSFNIPWYIFSDGEPSPLVAVHSALTSIGEPILSPKLFVIPNGKNFEQYITTDDYKDTLITMVISVDSQNEFHRQALEREWKAKADPIADLLNLLSNKNTKYAKPLAEAITKMSNEKLRFPELICSLFEKMSNDLGLDKRKDMT